MSISKATKNMFKNTLLELSKRQPLHKITVKTIIDHTNTAKQTFYNHFKDKYDLINFVLLDFVENIENTHAMYTYEGIMATLNYCEANQNFFTTIARENYQNNFKEFYREWCENYYIKAFQQIFNDNIPNFLLVAISFYCYGAVGIFIDWIKDDMKTPKELIASTIVNCRPALIAKYLLLLTP